jgi:superfamily II DNA/RNA helicase
MTSTSRTVSMYTMMLLLFLSALLVKGIFGFVGIHHQPLSFLSRTRGSSLFFQTDSPRWLLFLSSTTTNNNEEDDTDNESESSRPLYFNDLGLCPAALEAIEEQDRWYLPTPIQQLAIPPLLEKKKRTTTTRSSPSSRAFWCEAPTGSGKTAAFVLPLLQNLLVERQEQRRTKQKQKRNTTPPTMSIRSLILCPTRELAIQIGTVVQKVASIMMPSCNILVVTGGVRREDQITTLADWAVAGQSADIVIATPGRLFDVLTRYSSQNNNNDNDNTIKNVNKKNIKYDYDEEEDDEDDDDVDEDTATTIKTAADAALERRLLQAMELSSKKDTLTLEDIQKLQLDRTDEEGRQVLINLLQGLQYLIIDEADRLLSRSFETEMKDLLDLCCRSTTSSQQENGGGGVETWLFSATFPKAIEPRVDAVLQRLGHTTTTTTRISCTNADRLLDDTMSATLQKKLERKQQQQQQIVMAQQGPESTIQLRTIRVDKRDRTAALKQLWTDHHQEWNNGVLVFVATRYAAEHVSRKLKRVGIRSSELHGKLDQEARERRLRDLQSGKIQVLLATDVASRGLDVVGLSAVINYDLPRSTSDFVHRVGRTGRAGRLGDAITLVTPSTEAHYDLIEQRHIPTERQCEREMIRGLEVDESTWTVQAQGARIRTPGAGPSNHDLAHDRMFGGIKGKRKSKKDRLREEAAAAAHVGAVVGMED